MASNLLVRNSFDPGDFSSAESNLVITESHKLQLAVKFHWENFIVCDQ